MRSILTPTKARITPRPDVEVAELALHAPEQEVQGAQAEDGEGVGGEDDERFAADGQDRRDGVDGEDDVGRLDEHEHGEQRGGEPLRVVFGEQLLAVVGVRGRHDSPHESHGDVGVVVDLFGLVVMGDLPRRVEQERAEDVEDPLEAFDELDAGEDEDAAQHQRAEDAPEQDAELVLAGTAKNEKMTAHTKTLSMDRLFSMRNPA